MCNEADDTFGRKAQTLMSLTIALHNYIYKYWEFHFVFKMQNLQIVYYTYT